MQTIQAPPSRLHDVEIIEIDDDDDDDDEEEDEDEDDNLEDDLDDDDEDDDDDDDDDEEEDQKEDDNEEEDEENEEEDDMTGTDSMEERSSDFEETEQGSCTSLIKEIRKSVWSKYSLLIYFKEMPLQYPLAWLPQAYWRPPIYNKL